MGNRKLAIDNYLQIGFCFFTFHFLLLTCFSAFDLYCKDAAAGVAFVLNGNPVVPLVVSQLRKLAAAGLDHASFQVEPVHPVCRVIV